MSRYTFPSGRWNGFYVYPGQGTQHPMSARIKFTGGTLFGEGNDGIGPFTFSGWYAEDSGDCVWVKRYLGKHSVDYAGVRDGKGIWGTWNIGGCRGGFQLWPEQDAEHATDERIEEQVAPRPEPSVSHSRTALEPRPFSPRRIFGLTLSERLISSRTKP